MTSFYVTSFICSSVRATLTIFSMTSALAQKLACLNKCTCHRKNCQSTNFARLSGSTKKTCQSKLVDTFIRANVGITRNLCGEKFIFVQ